MDFPPVVLFRTRLSTGYQHVARVHGGVVRGDGEEAFDRKGVAKVTFGESTPNETVGLLPGTSTY